MRKKLFKLLIVLNVVGALVSAICMNASAQIRVYTKQQDLSDELLSSNGIIINDRTMVPVREVLEGLGYSVNWDGRSRTVTAIGAEGVLSLTIDKNYMYRNSKEFYCDVPPLIVEDRTYLPMRGISRLINYGISWNSQNRTVLLIPSNLQFVNDYNPNFGLGDAEMQLEKLGYYNLDCGIPDGCFVFFGESGGISVVIDTSLKNKSAIVYNSNMEFFGDDRAIINTVYFE